MTRIVHYSSERTAMPAEFPCPDDSPRAVHVHRAEPVGDAPPVEPVAIMIDLDQPPAPDNASYVAAARGRFVADAKAIADALYGHLPGGTLDALLAEMLVRRGSQLRVPLASADAS